MEISIEKFCKYEAFDRSKEACKDRLKMVLR